MAARDAPVRRTGAQTRRLRARRALVLAALIAALEAVTFGLYLAGLTVPPWDFFGSYNTDAYLWWSRGGFFDPVDWIPKLWAGYPAAAVLQNSAWYLPVGIAAAFGPFTLHSAAVVQALHVAFGAVGAYLLIRRMGGSFPPALLAAAAWFFAVGIYSNAEHVDIVRGYAWLPWLLLVVSPLWSWRRWWAIPTATILLWQAATGVYPGILIAAAYVLPFWAVAAFLIWRRPVALTVVGIAVSALGAALLSGPRILPYLMQSTAPATATPDTSQFSIWMLGTVAFGYGSPELPNDISMRSFFVPADRDGARLLRELAEPVHSGGGGDPRPAFCLGMPFLPWFDAAQALPGMSLSRFSMSDFKPFLIMGVLLLGIAGAYADHPCGRARSASPCRARRCDRPAGRPRAHRAARPVLVPRLGASPRARRTRPGGGDRRRPPTESATDPDGVDRGRAHGRLRPDVVRDHRRDLADLARRQRAIPLRKHCRRAHRVGGSGYRAAAPGARDARRGMDRR